MRGREYVIGLRDWRHAFSDVLDAHLLALGADPDEVKEGRTHVLGHDFPVSVDELKSIFAKVGFDIQAHDYNSRP